MFRNFCFTFLMLVGYVSAIDFRAFKNPPWDESQELSSVLAALTEGKVVYSCPMREHLEQKNKKAVFNNEVHYAILEYQDTHIAVVLKPKEGENVSSVYAEKVAFDLYEALIAPFTGHHFVPPTTVRTMQDGRITSCQYYVENEDSEDMWNHEFRTSVLENAPYNHIKELALFNSIFNNWDRHPGNYLATCRDGSYHLASIDNESIENKGILTEWGTRSYIPVLFTDDPRAQIAKEIYFDHCSLEEFKLLIGSVGFQVVPKVTSIYNNLFKKEDQNRSIYIHSGMLLIRYHQGSKTAFPLPQGPYSPELMALYFNITEEQLKSLFMPLTQFDARFTGRIPEILERRDLFLNSLFNEFK